MKLGGYTFAIPRDVPVTAPNVVYMVEEVPNRTYYTIRVRPDKKGH